MKQCLALSDKQRKWYREKGVVTNAWNAVAKEIKFIENGKSIKVDFNVVPGIELNSAVEKNRQVFIILTQK